jgi:hypothetical protein
MTYLVIAIFAVGLGLIIAVEQGLQSVAKAIRERK